MPPPRAVSAESRTVAADATDAITAPASIAEAIADFLAAHAEAVVLEDGKVLFDLRDARHTLSTEHGHCVLHLWSEERNLVRTVVGATPRRGVLRLATARFGHKQTKLIELAATRERRAQTTRDKARTHFVALLERVLARAFPEAKADGFRSAMDIEKSFGPGYARGTLVCGKEAWAVIGVNASETATTVDGVLTPGILWLHYCREHAAGKRLYKGLRVIVPRGGALLTQARMAWLNADAAQWELYELDEKSEELTARDVDDLGNVRTRLVHHPDEAAARERFAEAIAQVMQLVPRGEEERVDQHLRSASELAFLLHGLEFARARVQPAPNGFAHTMTMTVGSGAEETALTPVTREALAERVAELFARRRAAVRTFDFARSDAARRIGPPGNGAAHARLSGLAVRPRTMTNSAQDPLYRAAPERWLESVLRREIASLTRGLAADPRPGAHTARAHGDEDDADNIGNRAEPRVLPRTGDTKVIPRFDPRFLYAQVPAIAGASDRGMLDLLGLTSDGRLAVLELKADEDLHFALQGLDYWIRVRHHHLAQTDANERVGEFQRHGYFVGAELAHLPPRLFLIAPALRIHPATEVVLRYFARAVEWQLIALDERWREQVRVVWRKSSR